MKNIIHNLTHMWQSVGQKDGWDVSKNEQLLLLRSPTNMPNLNLAIIQNKLDDPSIITSYFNDRLFGVIEPLGKVIDLKIDPKASVTITEMQIASEDIQSHNYSENVKIVSTLQELQKWSEVAGTVFGADKVDLYKFLEPTYQSTKQKIFYYLDGDEIVGTGHIYMDDMNLVYVSTIGVLEPHRRKGIGKEIMNACLKNGIGLGGDTFALYASEIGEFLYKNIGFKEIAKWSFRVF